MVLSEDSTKDLANPFADQGNRTPQHSTTMNAMELDLDDDTSDTDSIVSSSLPTSFYSGIKSLEHRRVSASVLSTPKHTTHPVLMADAREAAIPRRRVMTTIPQPDDDDDDDDDDTGISTPTRVHGSPLGGELGSATIAQRPAISRSNSLLTRMHERGTLLGKHPQTPSPGEEPGTRFKEFKTLATKAGNDWPPTLPDFTLSDTTGLDRSAPLYSPIPPPNFGTPLGISKPKPFGLFGPASSSSGSVDNNPFLGSSTRKARFDMDYLSESQWYSDYPHHLTHDYLEELFNLDRRVMFTKTKLGSGDSPDYLRSNFYISEPTIGTGEFSDVLKVQNKHNKEFYAVKRLLRTVQGAKERKHYLNEVRNMWRVEKSPNVLQLLEAWEQKGKIYMRMELCKLGSLKSALLAQKRYRGLDEKRAWKCLRDMASGLRAIHDSNIIHLDIKPENVFISAIGALKIGDFGLSITYPIEVKDINEGDKYYLAQELLNGRCGKFSDIFSLGMTIYEIVTNQIGELPGEGPRWHYLRDGNVGMSEYLIEEGEVSKPTSASSSTVSSPPTLSEGPGATEPTSAAVSAEPSATSTPLSPFIVESALPGSTLSQMAGPNHRLFSREMIDLIKAMLQPAFAQRPTAANILNTPTIQRIVNKRANQSMSSTPTRSTNEAMSGLLLQSI
ncbi:hypothetical protein EDD11_006551 [Mortierella claussenii]|nr:hypothetical protein EDD11_006551 [Mortierella claussenii]